MCNANCGHNVCENLCGFCTRLPDARVQYCQRERFGIPGIEACLAFANCSVPSTMLTPAKNCSGMVPNDKMSRWVEARVCGYGI